MIELQARIALLKVALTAALRAVDYACGCVPRDAAEEIRSHIDGSGDNPNAFIILRQDRSDKPLRVLLFRERRRVVRAVSRVLGEVVDTKLLLMRVNEEMKRYEK